MKNVDVCWGNVDIMCVKECVWYVGKSVCGVWYCWYSVKMLIYFMGNVDAMCDSVALVWKCWFGVYENFI